MKNTIYLTGIVLVLILSSCLQKTTEQTSSSKHISEAGTLSEHAIIYSLPRTVIKIDVEYERIVGKKGPFYSLRGKHLGITEGLDEDFTSWRIKNINISSCNESDPAEYYMAENASNAALLEMTASGLVMTGGQESKGSINNIEDYYIEKPFYPDLTVKGGLEKYQDTASRLMPTDTGFVRVPYVEINTRYKSIDKKAEEAAAFIIKIRKRRFKLMSGQYDTFPEGQALQYAVEKLSALENEYLALFMGKTVRYSYTKSFEWIPKKNELSRELFKFSNELGMLSMDEEGEKIRAVLSPLGNTKLLTEHSYDSSDTVNVSGLIYRVPETSELTIKKEDTELLKQRLHIYQLGPRLRIPE